MFNAEQIDGLAPFIAPEPTFSPVERAEELLKQGEVPILHDQKDRAFYRPMSDEIHLPPQNAFHSQYDYYATALHELGHSTGHQNRMAREFGPFGSEAYARVELRAEIASYMLTTELGLGHYPERHAAYVGSWMRTIKEDRNVLFTAARDAEQIRSWVSQPELREQLKPVLAQEKQQEATKMVRKNRIVPEQREDLPGWNEKDVRENWMLHAGRLENMVNIDIERMVEAKNAFDQIDIAGQGSDDPAIREGAKRHQQETFARMDKLGNFTTSYAELLSVMYDAHPDQDHFKPLRPDWFIPAEKRENDLAKSLGTDPARGVADRVFERQAENTAVKIKEDWMLHAARLDGLPDGEARALNDAKNSFQRIDVWWQYSDDPDKKDRSFNQERETFTTMADLAGRSAKHAELLSAMYDAHPDQDYFKPLRPQWFVPEAQRTSELVKSLGADPGQKMADRFIAEQKQARQESRATNLAATTGPASQPKEAVVNNIAPGTEPNTPKKRHYLNVPYSEKNDAKALGAKWDRRAKSWYVQDDTDLKPFARWNEQTLEKPQSRMRPEEEFALACRENGLVIEGLPTMDGKWHRVSVESDRKGQKSGSYRGFIEGIPAGNIVNYKSGNEPVKWVSSAAERNPAEIERSKAEAAARKAQMEENLKAQYKQVAKRAYAMVQGADTASSDHVYLQRKQVGGETLKQDIHNNLLMPMTTAKGFIENVQVITPDGSKRFLKDGRKTGLMHMIPGTKKGPILIVEGYATGKSLNMATDYQTAIAMDSGNLAPVAEALQKAFPDRPLIIAADDDHGVEARQGINPGIKGAERAAALVDAAVIRPNLSPAEKQAGLTDFNDLHVARGIDSLAKTVKQQIKELGLTQKLQKAQTLPAPKQQQRSQRQQVAI
ncbi:zincin-like metallopeptidase domain-containing protein [Thalassospira marina]|uniref:Toprim domain-containing protein n=1 Tax=Thalassospira marina TaxID=2048283 RepID=A0ABN5FJJ2_9PROT|nr:zincin-like metallopeptidase domain-containing protein [Thalassospira marina]AUG55271.1 hypothetical protein CSC3H3_20530 [Thalassospira marina]